MMQKETIYAYGIRKDSITTAMICFKCYREALPELLYTLFKY